MLNLPTNHLRIHIEDGAIVSGLGLDLPAWNQMQTAYQGLTGWRLGCQPGSIPIRAEAIGEIPGLFGDQDGQLYRQRTADAPIVELGDQHAYDLAQAVAGVLVELQATRMALQQRESELASVVPVIARRNEGSDFDDRLQAILRGTVEGLRGRAAALYLLDEDTSELKLRCHCGLPSRRFLEPARPLRGAVADLEALTGHAVVLEDTQLFPHWNVPEAFASAVCVPVSSSDTLLGTLWLFGDEVRDYDDAETQLLEIIAGRLAVELERRVLVQEAVRNTKYREQSEELLTWQEEGAVQAPPLVEGWQVAATTLRDSAACGDFNTWRDVADNQLLLASSSISGSVARSTLAATLTQGALQAIFRQFATPVATLQTLNDVLWSSTPGCDGASMFVASLDPITGRLDYATAGATDAYVLRPHGWEPIASNADVLGQDADWIGIAQRRHIHAGDVLLVVSDRRLGCGPRDTSFDATCLAEDLLRYVHLSARELTDMAASLIAERCGEPWARSVLVVKRRG